ncbi:hypothetical protein ABZV92_19085 [Streptomyces rubiginosohelvolus]|uniref:hypothetical protein n=1 Tax=Streptomyces rubiginosohelvolus TaxID=67362 RepID=UPI0033A87A2E
MSHLLRYRPAVLHRSRCVGLSLPKVGSQLFGFSTNPAALGLNVRLDPYQLRAGAAQEYPDHHRDENGQPQGGVDDKGKHQPTCPAQSVHERSART